MPTRFTIAALALLSMISSPPVSADEPAKPLKAGIIGCDTSHVIAFTDALNDPKASGELAGVRVVAAFPGGSKDVEASHSRVDGYVKQLQGKGVEIVPSIDELLKKVDVVLLESVDGRPHLEQVRPVIAAGKPVFIDKPVAASLADALEIYRLAEEHKVPVFSSSSLRFSAGILGLRSNPKIGRVLGCEAHSPCSLEEHHPDLFWYGIHGVETLFTVMGPGCVSVSRTHTADTDVVVGTWKDGRIGTYRGLRKGVQGYGGLVFGEKAIAPIGKYDGYRPLVAEICKFFRTGKPPVSAEETLEIIAFMEAADESKRQGGKVVSIESVMEKARRKE
ncbi:MAG: Gfo/Idh/MocA family oxidoreductase [Gemmataceae bacterium]|nr:Gfo/Idh/MocA family oxidoreductase [Gemmataceae bacterium]